jgi:hypothetical protein
MKDYPILYLKRGDHQRLKELQLQIEAYLIKAYECPGKV